MTAIGFELPRNTRRSESQVAVLDADAERLCAAIVDRRRRHLDDPSSPLVPSTDLVFDPTSPTATDWERILSQHTERLLLRFRKREAKLPKSAPRPDIA